MVREIRYRAASGWVPLLIILLALVSGPLALVRSLPAPGSLEIAAAILLPTLAIISMAGFLAVQPNEARVLLLFGTYKVRLESPASSG